ncbi:tetratricopeptide repeat protein [Marinobacterium arenosum]|uniref:tetratricopeptide repeat protein n=1 Tax=Marinobacterium arenosum TaxID=2862496 RepID=UPI001C95E0A8|nr:sel1 repeat family protein [Marinobacterium arenosum]MBY4679026.1 sel1 repeat family protein [Marinobacterium arenosum]
MRLLMRVLAMPLFWVAYALFRSSIGKRSRSKHNLVMRLFRYAADNGSTRALSVYGHLLHFRGDGVQNRIQGGIYLQRAAEQGDMKARYQMGRIYEQGFEHYFRADPARALAFYRQAAEQGHPLALQRMVEACNKGELGLSVDEAAARQWQARQPSLPQR